MDCDDSFVGFFFLSDGFSAGFLKKDPAGSLDKIIDRILDRIFFRYRILWIGMSCPFVPLD